MATPQTSDDDDVIDLLLAQHARIRDLFDEVEQASGTRRAETFARLAQLLAVHESAEEEIVHPHARAAIDGGDGIVDDRLAEEADAKRLLAEMDKNGPDAADFMERLTLLRDAVTAHARSEERYEFPQLRARTTEDERRKFGLAVQASEESARHLADSDD
ncbi:hemerythrin domain-containing protein [Nonomuraea africana]|uniref:hemerythrin domain-containing protein n=1 Tax=Nonomuraea africana TaxID=46171 RepID=UPI0033E7F224